MTFIWPAALLLLLLLPLLVAWYLRLQQRRRQLAARYGTLGMVQAGGAAPGPDRARLVGAGTCRLRSFWQGWPSCSWHWRGRRW